ncbi:precorrin-6A reductase [Moorellaceae bacterium AZ2]
MILVMGGTGEGWRLAKLLGNRGYKVVVWVRSAYGCRVARDEGVTSVQLYSVTEKTFSDLMEQYNLKVVVDLSLPFPNEISLKVEDLCNKYNLCYLRFLRSETELPDHPLIHQVYSWEEAARAAASLGDTIFLTTGTNNLEVFLSSNELKNKRIVVRVLPEHRVIKKCQDLGLAPRDIVAMQGPFSRELNKAIFRAYKAKVVVTRDSGAAGGTDTKIAAALALNIPVVIIKRPPMQLRQAVSSLEEIVNIIRQVIS